METVGFILAWLAFLVWCITYLTALTWILFKVASITIKDFKRRKNGLRSK